MAREIVSPKLDIIFKKIFSENKDLLQSFVCALLDIKESDVQGLSLNNTELPPDTMDGKLSRLDLNMQINDILVNIEIQLRSQREFRERTLYYWSKLYTSELKQGERYGRLKRAISINIVDFNVFEDADSWHSEVVAVRKGTQEIFSDKFNIHFFELRKIIKTQDSEDICKLSQQELWLRFLNARTEEDMTMLENTRNTAIHKAVKVVYDMSEDTRIREFARMREKTLHDYASEMGDAEDKGREEGIQIGIQKAREEAREEIQKNREEAREEIQKNREEARKEIQKNKEETAAKLAKIMREMCVDEEIIQQKIAEI